jgi:hypothetical protein
MLLVIRHDSHPRADKLLSCKVGHHAAHTSLFIEKEEIIKEVRVQASYGLSMSLNSLLCVNN